MPHPEFQSGEPVFAEELAALTIRDTYTPELTATTTDPDLGGLGALAEGKFYATGALVWVEFHFTFGASPSAGSGDYLVSMPPAWPIDAFSGRTALGVANMRDDSSLSRENRFVLRATTTNTDVLFETVSGAVVSNNAPWTWAEGDSIRGTCSYLTTES